MGVNDYGLPGDSGVLYVPGECRCREVQGREGNHSQPSRRVVDWRRCMGTPPAYVSSAATVLAEREKTKAAIKEGASK